MLLFFVVMLVQVNCTRDIIIITLLTSFFITSGVKYKGNIMLSLQEKSCLLYVNFSRFPCMHRWQRRRRKNLQRCFTINLSLSFDTTSKDHRDHHHPRLPSWIFYWLTDVMWEELVRKIKGKTHTLLTRLSLIFNYVGWFH